MLRMDTFNNQITRPSNSHMLVKLILLCNVFTSLYAQHVTHKVKNGDTVLKILNKYDISKADISAFIALQQHNPFTHQIKPNDTILLDATNKRISKIVIQQPNSAITLDRTQHGYDYTEVIDAHPITRQFVHFTIDHSLFLDGRKAGAPHHALANLPDIFTWDIDFKKDIRPGTQVTMIYEDQANHQIGNSVVLARIKNGKKSWEAIRFKQTDGAIKYVSPEGKSYEKTFLKYPLKFKRISSHFSNHRPHPILKINRPHHGVDFAANTGTPVSAASSGKVLSAGWHGGYGKTVVVQHSPRVKTVYAHLNTIPQSTKVGQPVAKGQTIGYVGNTGRSTGPHLHYEFHIDNVPQNPLKVSLPRKLQLNTKEMAVLAAERQQCLAMIPHGLLS